MLRFADLRHTFIGECDGDASTHVDSDGEWSDCEVPESHSDEDEWTANGVIVRRPDRKGTTERYSCLGTGVGGVELRKFHAHNSISDANVAGDVGQSSPSRSRVLEDEEDRDKVPQTTIGSS